MWVGVGLVVFCCFWLCFVVFGVGWCLLGFAVVVFVGLGGVVVWGFVGGYIEWEVVYV